MGSGILLGFPLNIIMIINGLFMLGTWLILFIKEKWILKNTVVTKATVIRYLEYSEAIHKEYINNICKKINATTYTAEVEYTNEEGKKEYAFYRVFTEYKPFQIGEEIEILYNKNDSSYFILKNDKVNDAELSSLLVIGIVFFMVGILLLI